MSNGVRFFIGGQDVCEMGLESARLSLRAGGPDRLELTYETASASGAHLYATGSTVAVSAVVGEGEDAVGTTLFLGRVVRTPASEQCGATRRIVVENGWTDLRKCPLVQTWASRAPLTGQLTTLTVSRALLGQADNGDPMTSGQVLADIILRAAGQGAMVAAGSIGGSLPLAPTEVVDTSCDAAFRQILGYHPDHVAFMEGSVMHVRPASSLPSVSVDTAGSVVEVDPDDSEKPSGVVIVFERTHTLDGQEWVERIVQSAGSMLGWPPPVRMTIPLRGSERTTLSQEFETRRLPDPGDLDSETSKRFFRSIIPALSEADSADIRIRDMRLRFADAWEDDLDEQGQLRDSHARQDSSQESVGDYPRQILSGEVQPWMPGSIKQFDASLTARVYYRGDDDDIRALVGEGVEVSEPLTISNVLPRTYRVTDSITQGEEPPPNLAATYWGEISQPRVAGSARGPVTPQSLSLRPGARAVVSGRMPNPQPVRETTYDLVYGTYQASWGPSDLLSPRSIVDLSRAARRNAPTWRRPEERTAGAALGGSSAVREGARPVNRVGGPRSTVMRPQPWMLVAGSDAGTYRIVPGTISKGLVYDPESTLEIENAEANLSLSAGDMIWLELTRDLALTIESGSTWEGYPYAVETELTDDAIPRPRMKAMRYLLWEVMDAAGAPPDAMPLGEGLAARRLAPDDHFHLVAWVQEGSQARVVETWWLLPGPGTRTAAE